ncbi:MULTISPECIES: hypothetical protein [unclassified Nostoc]|nr:MULTISPECIES: hypothetical protein [unclassified Nostoc]MDM9584970.1 hypothetical protein [Nostoc sp. GT001]MDZ7944360.1 hypothetical protein [Nostoc sp. EfeVER01]MDZ7995510.1 hypothetical protein [Nostoc sp. EspVER01]
MINIQLIMDVKSLWMSKATIFSKEGVDVQLANECAAESFCHGLV